MGRKTAETETHAPIREGICCSAKRGARVRHRSSTPERIDAPFSAYGYLITPEAQHKLSW
jgi:hypothetical protein